MSKGWNIILIGLNIARSNPGVHSVHSVYRRIPLYFVVVPQHKPILLDRRNDSPNPTLGVGERSAQL